MVHTGTKSPVFVLTWFYKLNDFISIHHVSLAHKIHDSQAPVDSTHTQIFCDAVFLCLIKWINMLTMVKLYKLANLIETLFEPTDCWDASIMKHGNKLPRSLWWRVPTGYSEKTLFKETICNKVLMLLPGKEQKNIQCFGTQMLFQHSSLINDYSLYEMCVVATVMYTYA